MFPAWRMQLREARLAVNDGRWDEAAELLAGDQLREFLPAKRLSQELARQLMDRAHARINAGQSTAGWRDLHQAARLGAGETEIVDFRRRETVERLSRVIAALAVGDTIAARRQLEKMEHRNLGGEDRRTWQMIAQHMDSAEASARKGDMATALELLAETQRFVPANGAKVAGRVEGRGAEFRTAADKIHALDARLHAALAASDWTEVLADADALLELAPQHSAARKARSKAWQAVGMELTQAHRPSPARGWAPMAHRHGGARINGSTRQNARNGKADTVTNDRRPGKRMVAWIDEVGAYLVCMGDEIVLGQPSPEGVDVAILADLSRRHAIIRRDGESYVLTPIHRAAVDGREVQEPTVLRDKSVIKLGGSVELRFRRPHALSATAVLEIVSHHRTEPAVDTIVLMSESCILGAQPHSHVRCRDWQTDLVLFRRGDELMCRTQSPIVVNGETCVGQAAIDGDCRIEGDQFALSLEEI